MLFRNNPAHSVTPPPGLSATSKFLSQPGQSLGGDDGQIAASVASAPPASAPPGATSSLNKG